jgi:glycosyltransferase involved in cell wall biosynthesis
MQRADTISVSSYEETLRLADLYGKRSEVWASTIEPVSDPPELDFASRNILWIGSLTYGPNVDGLLRLIACAGAVLVTAGYRLVIAGSGASPDLESELSRHVAVDYRGYVEDLLPVAGECVAGIVPLWAGAGIKLKTLTMMSLGLPVASTSVGFEGIPPDAALVLNDDPVQLVRDILALSAVEMMSARIRGLEVIDTDLSNEATMTQVRAYVLEHGYRSDRARA